MRVNSHVLDAYGQQGVDRAAKTKSESANLPEQSKQPDSTQATSLSISNEAKRLAAANAAVDTEKVAAIKNRIESGEFEVNPTKIAEKILDHLA